MMRISVQASIGTLATDLIGVNSDCAIIKSQSDKTDVNGSFCFFVQSKTPKFSFCFSHLFKLSHCCDVYIGGSSKGRFLEGY